jgi:2-desacetyl-2-hydroxyethyl bacteriochlorophyllide A dehydrogenase
MKKAIIVAKETFDIQEAPIPKPGHGQVLVKVKAVGLCTMEQRYYNGGVEDYPFHGGHEICGEVVECGEGVAQKLVPGQKIVVASLTRCGECYFCRRGLDHLCENADEAHEPGELWGPGGLAEYMLVKSYEVFPVAEDIDETHATLAEPVACVVRSVEKGNLRYGDVAIVQGAGVMGVLHVKLAKLQGAVVVVSEPDANRRQKAVLAGADYAINPLEEDLRTFVKSITEGRGAEACFFTAGGNKAIEEGLRCLVKCGVMVIYGSVRPAKPVGFIPNDVHYDEIVITGAIKTSKDSFQKTARMLGSKLIDVSDLVSETYSLKDINKAFERAQAMETYRVVLLFNEEN